jgi:L-alanine-DL-glutamate epimerase-like enolase superfamily enzyme
MTMRITRIETLRLEAMSEAEWERAHPRSRQAAPNNLWVRIHTDDGLVGLGETYYAPRAVAAVVHDVFAPQLLGRSAYDIENHGSNLAALASFSGTGGAEMRAISAIDIALWDLLGQHVGQPVHNLLGGRSRERVPIYNTCVSWGRHDDFHAWTEGRAGELARGLLAEGCRAMKVWPFDRCGWTLGGPEECGPAWSSGARDPWAGPGRRAHALADADLDHGLAIIEQIRRATDGRMRIAVEGHARWDLPSATRIARALEPYDILWLEEPMPPDEVEAFVRLKAATSVPLCQSERLMTRQAFRQMIDRAAADIIMPDVVWCGGISEMRKIAAMADASYLPITSHDTVGPVALLAAAHVMLHIPNAMVMETVRGYTDGWYGEILDRSCVIRDGHLGLEGRPGLGAALRPEVLNSPRARIETST